MTLDGKLQDVGGLAKLVRGRGVVGVEGVWAASLGWVRKLGVRV
jgi:hypothetical protein